MLKLPRAAAPLRWPPTRGCPGKHLPLLGLSLALAAWGALGRVGFGDVVVQNFCEAFQNDPRNNFVA